MVTHNEIWKAVDELAARYGMSPSGLAKKAGLDPTTFNKSKRMSKDGKLRWPSTESVSKILHAVGADMSDFTSLIEEYRGRKVTPRIPVLGFAQAGNDGFFDDGGLPVGQGWDEVDFPDLGLPDIYALEIQGDSMEPVYRDGDTIIVSPSANIRRGDRVVVRTREGEVLAKQLHRKTVNRVELVSLNDDYEPRDLDMADVDWIARVVWASQ